MLHNTMIHQVGQLISAALLTLSATACAVDENLTADEIHALSEEQRGESLIELDYGAWIINYNCEARGFQSFHFTTVPDTANVDRYKPFHQEPLLPAHCRQKTTGTYKRPKGELQYDRGHGVDQNQWEHSPAILADGSIDTNSLIYLSNSMANIVPHARSLNRNGVWRYTEKLAECYRDFDAANPVEVWGGNIWGNSLNDHFISSHGVRTPDYIWKVIRFPNGQVNAWLMPNTNRPTNSRLDSYLVAPATLEKITGQKFASISRTQRTQKDSRGVRLPKGCDLS